MSNRLALPRLMLADFVVAAIVLTIGVIDVANFEPFTTVGTNIAGVLVVLLASASVLLSRWKPLIALGLMWAAGFLMILGGAFMLVMAGAIWLAYGTSRHGSTATLVVSGISLPLAAFIGTVYTVNNPPPFLATFAEAIRGPWAPAPEIGPVTLLLMLSALPIVIPWLIGLVGRARAKEEIQRQFAAEARFRQQQAQQQAERARKEEARAQRIAALEASSAQLARDVHDVVGHSLAVILAQAESAQFQEDPAGLKKTMENIAASSRRSLGEIRSLLSAARTNAGIDGRGTSAIGQSYAAPQSEAAHAPGEEMGARIPEVEIPAALPDIDALIDSVRNAGSDVHVIIEGKPQPLPPELHTAAYRVAQEMLTNALRHGVPGSPIIVEQWWADQLRLSVRNRANEGHERSSALGGMGIPSMRNRLQAVGGSFDFEKIEGESGTIATATAWIPLRDVTGENVMTRATPSKEDMQ